MVGANPRLQVHITEKRAGPFVTPPHRAPQLNPGPRESRYETLRYRLLQQPARPHIRRCQRPPDLTDPGMLFIAGGPRCLTGVHSLAIVESPLSEVLRNRSRNRVVNGLTLTRASLCFVPGSGNNSLRSAQTRELESEFEVRGMFGWRL